MEFKEKSKKYNSLNTQGLTGTGGDREEKGKSSNKAYSISIYVCVSI